MKTTFQNGNREVTVSIIGNADWSKGDLKRVYFDLSFEGAKLAPIDKIYEVISGGTADNTHTFNKTRKLDTSDDQTIRNCI